MCSLSLWLTSNWQEELEFWGELVLGVESIGEIDSSDSAVSMNLNSEGFYVVGTVGPSGEIRQVELNLIPALIKSHWHCANEWLDSGSGLIVGGSESTSNALVIEDLHFESKVLLQVLDDHDEEGQFDGERLLRVEGRVDVVRRNVGAHDLEDGGLNIGIGDTLDVAVAYDSVPDLQGLGADGVQNGKETALIGGLKHFSKEFE